MAADSNIVITQTHEAGLHRLALHFRFSGERLLENMRLMAIGEALFFENGGAGDLQPIFTSWHPAIDVD